MPVAETENDALCPTVTVWLTGCVAMEGATATALTVRVARLLVALPVELLTMTLNCAPLSELVVAGVVYAAEFAPLMVTLFFFH